jgi:predicted permease
MFATNPGITATALITLALVIGANSTIFSLVDTFLLQGPHSVKEPSHLFSVADNSNGRLRDFYISYPDYLYYRDNCQSFSELAAHYSTAPLNLVADGIDQEVNGAVVSHNYFAAVGIAPYIGRFFTAEEDAAPGRNPVAVLSFDCWQRRFDSDAAVLGKTIRVNATAFTVIGVAPEGFSGTLIGFPNELWIPTAMSAIGYRWCDVTSPDCTFLHLDGRLRPGKSASEAAAEMTALSASLRASRGENEPAPPLTLASNVGVRLDDQRDTARLMSLLTITVVVLLLIACANLAGLFLARGIGRRKEIAIRLSIGASRARLVRQLVTESILLSVAGSLGGLMISVWARDILIGMISRAGEGTNRYYETNLNARVLAYSTGLAVLVGLLFGLVPALQSTRPGLVSALKGDATLPSHLSSRLRGGLVMGQVALALLLVSCSGLLARSVRNIVRGAGFEPDHVAVLRLRPRLIGYSPARAQRMTQEAIRRLGFLPGVKSVSLGTGSMGYLWEKGGSLLASLPGQQTPRAEDRTQVYHHQVGPRFFESLGIPLLSGRDFDDRDGPDSPRVAIASRTLADQMWPGEEPVGKTLIVQNAQYRIIGLVADTGYRTSAEDTLPRVYLAYWQNPIEQQIDARMCVRVAGDPGQLLPSIRQTIQGVDPDVPITEDMPMIAQIMSTFQPLRLMSSVVVVSGMVALVLGAIGLYGVLAFNVGQRTREIGIRIALGAQSSSVVRMILGQGLVLAGIGMAAGLAVSFGARRVLSSFLFGVGPNDLLSTAAAVVILSGVAVLACYLPARTVARLDPVAALRRD